MFIPYGWCCLSTPYSHPPAPSSFAPHPLALYPTQADVPDPRLCALEHHDYKECLHRHNLKKRLMWKAGEIRKQEAADGGSGGGAHAAGGH